MLIIISVYFRFHEGGFRLDQRLLHPQQVKTAGLSNHKTVYMFSVLLNGRLLNKFQWPYIFHSHTQTYTVLNTVYNFFVYLFGFFNICVSKVT